MRGPVRGPVRGHGGRRLVALVLLAGLVPLTQVSFQQAPARAAAPVVGDYRGLKFPDRIDDPTADKPQSKLWFAHGSWWGVLVSDGGATHVRELEPSHYWRDTGTVVDSRRNSLADVLWTGHRLLVVSASAGSALQVRRYHFVGGDRPWRLDPGFPVSLIDAGPVSATIAEDSTGTLWATWVAAGRVWVAHTLDDQRVWSAPFVPVGADTVVSMDDISAVVSFDHDIGVMWSDQHTSTFRFAVHRDGSDDGAWSFERAASGYLDVDDHISLQAAPTPTGTKILAAVKTSLDEVPGVPGTAEQIAVLERAPDGRWTSHPAGDVADGHTQPILAVDSVNDEVYLIAQSAGRGLYYKRSPIDDIAFVAGPGESLIAAPRTGGIRSATASKAPGTEKSGLVVLANAPAQNVYYHAEISLQPVPADRARPSRPAVLTAQPTGGCQVKLLWTPASDDTEVAGYRLERNGRVLATVPGTTFTDTTAQCGQTLQYAVTTVDFSHHTSEARISEPVTLPSGLGSGGITLLGTTSNTSGGTDHVDLPAPVVQAGDVILASVDVSGTASVRAPAGWRLVRRDKQSARLTKATFVRVAASDEPASYRFQLGDARAAVGLAVAYRGVSGQSPVVLSAGQGNATSTEVTAPSVSIDSAQEVVVGLFGVGGLVAVTPPPSMVALMTQGGTTLGPRRVTGAVAGLQGEPGATGPLVAASSRAWASVGQTVVLRPEGP